MFISKIFSQKERKIIYPVAMYDMYPNLMISGH